MARKTTTQDGRNAPRASADIPDDGAVEDAEIVGGEMRRRADPAGARIVTPAASGPEGGREAASAGRVAAASAVTEDAPEAAPAVARAEAPAHEETAARREPAAAVPQVTSSPAAAEGGGGPGFLPLLLGGIAAGAIGYLAALFLAPAEPVVLDDGRLTALEDEVALLRVDPGAAQDGAAEDLLEPLRAAQADLSTRLDALSDRLAALEGRAVDPAELASAASTANLPPAEVEAIRTGLDGVAERLDVLEAANADDPAATDALRGEVEAQVAALRDDLTARVAAVEAGLAEALARAETVEDDAEALAREAARNQVAIALESGAPYAKQVAILPDLPAALAAPAEDGVATLAELRADFPPLARAALREVRAETAGGGLGSLAGRFLNARSIEPREGDDPDAVLSRAEAAVREGDVAAALGEIDALPPDAQAVLADWKSRAETRAAATSAFNEYLKDG